MKAGKLSSEAQAEMQSGLQLDPKLRAFIPREYLANLR
jgi:hypothetical protein